MTDLKTELINSGKTIPAEIQALLEKFDMIGKLLESKGHTSTHDEIAKGITGNEVVYQMREKIFDKISEKTDDEIAFLNERADLKIEHLRAGGDPKDFRLKFRKKQVKMKIPEAAAQTLWDTHHDRVLRGVLSSESDEINDEKQLLIALLKVYPNIG